jgi:tRNA A-37 threonylcarbamoyl transferase component Bud32
MTAIYWASELAREPSLPASWRLLVPHVDDNVLTAFVARELTAVEQSRIREHLDDCEDCRVVVRVAVERSNNTPSRADTLAAGSVDPLVRPSQRRLLKQGESVGPYVIERLVGSGGMGVVYAARDPRLDRRVALKLIRHLPGLAREQIEERMRRESKALARLSHANVTVVYELGPAGEEVFVAMEYVAGATLRDWLRARPRTSTEILATFAQAGRGLAAAHAAGLVHRDFKPDNVLIGEDGVAKVTDFGLARIAGEVGAPADDGPVGPTSVELTAAGSVIGRPRTWRPSSSSARRPTRARTSSASASRSTRRCTASGRSPARASRSSRGGARGAPCRALRESPRACATRCCVGSPSRATIASRRWTSCSRARSAPHGRRDGMAGGAIATAAIAPSCSQRRRAGVCGADVEVARVWNAERQADAARVRRGRCGGVHRGHARSTRPPAG